MLKINLAHSNAMVLMPQKLKKDLELKFEIEFRNILGLGIEKDLNKIIFKTLTLTWN